MLFSLSFPDETLIVLKVSAVHRSILWSHWYLQFPALDSHANLFQSQVGFIITCVVFLIVRIYRHSHLWLPGWGNGTMEESLSQVKNTSARADSAPDQDGETEEIIRKVDHAPKHKY